MARPGKPAQNSFSIGKRRKNRGENDPARAGLTRRGFLRQSLGLAAFSALSICSGKTALEPRLRAAIIGHTGHGDYGHEHDLIFNSVENVEVVAVADPDESGRSKAVKRARAKRGYADYREMLDKERPQLVCVAQRWTDEHHAMALAALKIGAHVYIEKPITQTLAEADELLDVAEKAGLKIAVPHQMRLAQNILLLQQRVEDELLGELIELRAHGKQDHRAGGEDLVVLGVHLFDLLRLFAGDAKWCSARILQNGEEITLRHAHPATEKIGPIAGDDIVAQFEFKNGVQGTFTSRQKNQAAAGPWGFEMIGSKSSVRVLAGMVPQIYFAHSNGWSAQGKSVEWKVWDQDPTLKLSAEEAGVTKANKRVVKDWLEAIERDREPACSGRRAMKALEMVMAVFAAGLTKARVGIPLKNRRHPLLPS